MKKKDLQSGEEWLEKLRRLRVELALLQTEVWKLDEDLQEMINFQRDNLEERERKWGWGKKRGKGKGSE